MCALGRVEVGPCGTEALCEVHLPRANEMGEATSRSTWLLGHDPWG